MTTAQTLIIIFGAGSLLLIGFVVGVLFECSRRVPLVREARGRDFEDIAQGGQQ